MKKELRISRIIISILTLIIFNILFIHEATSWKLLTLLFALISYISCFPGSIACKLFIKNGDKIKNIFLKIIYYIVILIVLVLLILFEIWIVGLIYKTIPTANDIVSGLTVALLFLFISIVLGMFIIIPYIQTLIILILRKIKKKN